MPRELNEETEHKNLMKRGSMWYVKRMVNGAVIIQSTGKTKLKDARTARDRILNATYLRDEKERTEALISKVANVDARLAQIDIDSPATTIPEGWQAYLKQSNRPDSGESTLRQYEFQYEAFAKWFKESHPQADKDGKPIRWELRQVTQEEADTYASELLKRVGPSTFNRHTALLALVWRVLEKTARLPVNVWKQIGRKRFVVRSRRELTVEELGKVFNAAQGEMRVLLALGTFCGLRLADAACLDWGNVDLARGFITLIPKKTARRTQKRVTLPIHRTLFDMLTQMPPKQRHGPVLPAMAARYAEYDGALAKDVARLFLDCDIKTNANRLTHSERASIKAAKEAAGKDEAVSAPVKANPKRKDGRASADCGFHSLRHTFVSLCAAGGVSQAVVQSLVGHGNPAMTAHYTHIDVKTAQSAVALLPDVTGETTAPAPAAGAKLEAVLAGLEGLSKMELEKVAARMKEMMGKV